MGKNYFYNDVDPKSIEAYAKKLIGHTFNEVISWDVVEQNKVAENQKSYGNSARKGGLGNLLEEKYFGYDANSTSEADFQKAGVELKVSPYEIKRDGSLKAGERLVLGMISYEKPIEDTLFESHIWDKCKLLLLIYYLREKEIKDNLQYHIDYVKLFTPPEDDLEIIKNDFEIISEKIRSGKAHELSEGDTMYLGACTKGATAEKSIVPQYYNPEVSAKKRAYCYKNSYMTAVLNNYIVADKETYESIVKDTAELKYNTFQSIIEGKINQYIGKSDKELCALFDRPYNNNKAQWIDLAYRMLGIKSNKAEEFIKANIVVKAIRLEADSKMVESSSLPVINFKKLAEEEWDESELFRYFDETKFFFVVYKRDGEEYRLKGCQLWNMPYHDLHEIVYDGWKSIQTIIREGVKLEVQETKSGKRVTNNLPSKSANAIIHIRPHSQKAFYRFENGETIGDDIRNANELPDGRWMTTQSFWLNNSYILSQLDEKLKQ